MDVEDRVGVKTYYSQKDLVKAVVETCKHREFAPTYRNGYGKRPDAINFPGDFKRFVEKGMVAFHGSVERWRNPLLIDTVKNQDTIRTGWDLVIDIDSEVDLNGAKAAAKLLIDLLEDHGVETVDIKFSGNRGFHLGVPHTCFPDKVGAKDISNLYPELPQTIVTYLRERIREDLENAVPEFEEGNIFELVEVENNWSSRHLFRLPYSINEKSGYASLPLAVDELDDFEKPDAEPRKIKNFRVWMQGGEPGEANELVREARDWMSQQETDTRTRRGSSKNFTRARPEDAVAKEYFPPTITKMLQGLKDGRKRAVFILTTFLRQVGYDWDSVESELWAWNDRNDEPLDDSYIQTQLDWHKKQTRDLMPPNFDVDHFYKDMGVYEEDELMKTVSNPVTYALKKSGAGKDDSDKKVKEVVGRCPYCGKPYRSKAYLKKHVEQCFAEERVVTPEEQSSNE